MKKLFISMAFIGALLFAGQDAFAACCCQNQHVVKTPFYYYLNPLQYVGIGNNYSSFTLNPVKGFKNCDRAKVMRCDECTKIKPQCPKCEKAKTSCNTCKEILIPKRTSCK